MYWWNSDSPHNIRALCEDTHYHFDQLNVRQSHSIIVIIIELDSCCFQCFDTLMTAVNSNRLIDITLEYLDFGSPGVRNGY
ncbi:hypothetical protein TNCV_922161 [Trichonephila clavipes]|nr:hypothetical protein TNCV_922161 [Trichonephila clavipes]